VSVYTYPYPYEYYAAGLSPVTVGDSIHRCVHCETSGVDETYTYCPNCKAIACDSHIKTERLEGKLICTGCKVTEQFVWRAKFFYDKNNFGAFRKEYAHMPIHEKAMENMLLAGESVVAVFFMILNLLVVAASYRTSVLTSFSETVSYSRGGLDDTPCRRRGGETSDFRG